MVKKPEIRFIDHVQKALQLTDKQRELLHEAITKQGLTKEEIWDMAYFIKEHYADRK